MRWKCPPGEVTLAAGTVVSNMPSRKQSQLDSRVNISTQTDAENEGPIKFSSPSFVLTPSRKRKTTLSNTLGESNRRPLLPCTRQALTYSRLFFAYAAE